ncbi:MAG: chemotaxis response regulator protein-glutamate methylesterase [Desulfatiglans sp.]|jgi:two-component system chemotaxis response regulator CheB|nr:chemotaxis response regulator protein-glutamate methylesterase [Desulfatiglans sp.]
MEKNPLRVLVVDDTVVYRKTVSDVLAEIPGVEVVGTANNGKIAMMKIASLKPDLITLDIEMPEMNGLDVLRALKTEAPDVGAIVLSTLTHKGGDLTIKALELGAFDYITKPETGSIEESKRTIKKILDLLLKSFSRHLEMKKILRSANYGKAYSTETLPGQPDLRTSRYSATTSTRSHRKAKAEIIGIGISTGGPKALSEMMPRIPANINVPILIVQHMPPMFTNSLAKSLNARCAIEVKEAEDGEVIRPNVAFIAPGGKQMKVVAGVDGLSRIIRITDDPPENSCKPSVDYLFRSIAEHYVGRSAGVIMTGMGSDGTLGLRLMKRNGSFIIAQDEPSCVVFGMPKKPIDEGIVDIIAPLERLADEIVSSIKSI